MHTDKKRLHIPYSPVFTPSLSPANIIARTTDFEPIHESSATSATPLAADPSHEEYQYVERELPRTLKAALEQAVLNDAHDASSSVFPTMLLEGLEGMIRETYQKLRDDFHSTGAAGSMSISDGTLDNQASAMSLIEPTDSSQMREVASQFSEVLEEEPKSTPDTPLRIPLSRLPSMSSRFSEEASVAATPVITLADDIAQITADFSQLPSDNDFWDHGLPDAGEWIFDDYNFDTLDTSWNFLASLE